MVDKSLPTVEQRTKLLVLYEEFKSYFNARMFLYVFHYQVVC